MSEATLLLHLHASMAWTGAILTLTLPLVRRNDIYIYIYIFNINTISSDLGVYDDGT